MNCTGFGNILSEPENKKIKQVKTKVCTSNSSLLGLVEIKNRNLILTLVKLRFCDF